MTKLKSFPKNRTISVVLWAFLLNTLWEFTQCVFLYDMWSWPFWKGTIWMWAAVFGDILIVLTLWKGITKTFNSIHFFRGHFRDYCVLVLISFFAAIFLEWIALYWELWSYNESMPSINILGQKVGISPILQITILPALSLFFAEKFQSKATYDEV